MASEQTASDGPGKCPRCGGAAEWLPVDESRRGRACRACGWIELPEVPVVRHTVRSLLRRLLPNSRLVSILDYLCALRQARREEKRR